MDRSYHIFAGFLSSIFACLFVIILLTSACQKPKKLEIQEAKVVDADQALWEKATLYLRPVQPRDTLNTTRQYNATVALGKKLFFDNNLSVNRNQSCGTCHKMETYGVDNKKFSVGSNDDLGSRNTPSVFNASEQFAQFWDARADNLVQQATGPILNPVEMAMPTPESVLNRVLENPEYVRNFSLCFPDSNPAVSMNNLATAISLFEVQLTTPSRFDKYLQGDLDAISSPEKQGLGVFMESGCIPCHGGVGIGGKVSQEFPLYGRMEDFLPVSSSDPINSDGKLLLKIPSLRNIEKTEPYFHNGSVKTLAEVVNMCAKAQTNNTLTREEIAQIGVFLITLTGSIPEIAKTK